MHQNRQPEEPENWFRTGFQSAGSQRQSDKVGHFGGQKLSKTEGDSLPIWGRQTYEKVHWKVEPLTMWDKQKSQESGQSSIGDSTAGPGRTGEKQKVSIEIVWRNSNSGSEFSPNWWCYSQGPRISPASDYQVSGLLLWDTGQQNRVNLNRAHLTCVGFSFLSLLTYSKLVQIGWLLPPTNASSFLLC